MSEPYESLPTEDPSTSSEGHSPPPEESTTPFPPSSESSSAPTLPLLTATNLTSIIYRNKDLKGTYFIDNTIQIPSFIFAPQHRTAVGDELLTSKPRPNARFGTTDGDIDLVLHLKGKGVTEVEVELVVSESSTPNHFLRVAIVEKDPLVVLRLKISAKGGSTIISLPPSFRGLVQGGSTSGEVIFSPALLPRTTIYAVNQVKPGEGRYYIGDLEGIEVDGEREDVITIISEWKDERNITFQESGEGVLEPEDVKRIQKSAAEFKKVAEKKKKKSEDSDVLVGIFVILLLVILFCYVGLRVGTAIGHLFAGKTPSIDHAFVVKP